MPFVCISTAPVSGNWIGGAYFHAFHQFFGQKAWYILCNKMFHSSHLSSSTLKVMKHLPRLYYLALSFRMGCFSIRNCFTTRSLSCKVKQGCIFWSKVYIGKSVAFCAKNVVKEKHPVNYYFYSGVENCQKRYRTLNPMRKSGSSNSVRLFHSINSSSTSWEVLWNYGYYAVITLKTVLLTVLQN